MLTDSAASPTWLAADSAGRDDVVREANGAGSTVVPDSRGEDRAQLFAALYRKHRSSLVWHVRAQGATESEASDAVQEAFAAALRAGRIRDDNAWHAWLRTVAVRSFRHVRRGAGPAHGVIVEPVAVVEMTDPHRPPEMSAADASALQAQEQFVLTLLNRLPPLQRLVFSLHYEGCSTREIATQLGMQDAAIRKNISRARRLLAELVSKVGDDET